MNHFGYNMKTIYLAGPMRGIPLYNFPAFDAAKRELAGRGLYVISPADLDRESGFDPVTLPRNWDWKALPERFCLKQAVQRDLEAVCKCDALCLLPGWENSRGAKAEKSVAEWVGKEVFELYPKQHETILEEAARITSGDRNASYGPPNQDFQRTAEMWTGLFRDKLKDGKKFEPQDIATAMILLKCSRQVHQKKRDNWVDIAGYAYCGNRCDEATA